eukprot:CAMPEP_0168564674 /NCGR_PEP_ID=MMETSP0413-20121227/13380_1 /TAXON_ID=136452 /ORGANISM="Filamoeba nolandi, Strain NC-AS-23-1" /LENGTH=233 /DNA_ID=CAMNT_0008596379 /DNA_START=38 /DNA_END=736 /DNA_ORIENTATION=-
MSIFTPVNQVRMTNVCVVRMKKGGKRFEIACYPNKVLSWRDKVETDIDEVVQSHGIFTNVSKGVFAKKDEIKKSFGTEDSEKVLLEILDKGELQVGSKEREHMQDKTFRDIATIVAEKCVDPETKRPLTVSMVERAMKDIHYNLHPGRSAKQQALEVIKQLKEANALPIERAQMKLGLVLTEKDGKRLKEQLAKMCTIEKEEFDDDQYIMDCLIDPGQFRTISEFIKNETKGK